MGSRWVVCARVVAGIALLFAARSAAADPAADSARVALPPATVRHWQVGLLRPDRIQHASLSWTVSLAVGLATRRPGAGLAAGLGLGLAKELHDLRGSGFDAVDLCADALGAGGAAWATQAIEH